MVGVLVGLLAVVVIVILALRRKVFKQVRGSLHGCRPVMPLFPLPTKGMKHLKISVKYLKTPSGITGDEGLAWV